MIRRPGRGASAGSAREWTSFCVRIVLCALASAAPWASRAHAQEPLDALIARIESVADESLGVTEPERALADQLRAQRGAAIPRLLPFLSNPRHGVRKLVGYTLRDIEGLQEEHLEPLIAACRRGEGWLPPAIARIGTPRALEFLVETLVLQPQPGSQFTCALELLGARGACALAAPLRNRVHVEPGYFECLDEVLHKLGSRAAPAVDALLEVACDRSFALAERQFAVSAIGKIGIAARRATPALRALARFERESFDECVEETLIAIGGPEAVEILVQRLRAHPRNSTLQDLAELGEAARSAAPLVADLLENPHLRATAAETLGWLGDAGCASALLAKLADDDNWLVVDKTSEALGRLRAMSALSALQSVAERHWFARVRRTAAKAIEVIRGVSEYDDASAEAE